MQCFLDLLLFDSILVSHLSILVHVMSMFCTCDSCGSLFQAPRWWWKVVQKKEMRKTRGGCAPFPKSCASYFRFARFNTFPLYYLRAWHRLFMWHLDMSSVLSWNVNQQLSLSAFLARKHNFDCVIVTIRCLVLTV